MPYPWPSFGSFQWHRDETAIFGTDTGWNRQPGYAQSRPLGSARDSIVTLAIGSAARKFECLLSPSRYDELAGLVNSAAFFTDWERPAPGQRFAFLANIEQRQWVAVRCSDGETEKRIRTVVSLISQD